MLKFFDEQLYTDLIEAGLGKWKDTLPQQLESIFTERAHGQSQEWLTILAALPKIKPSEINLTTNLLKIGSAGDCDEKTREALKEQLQALQPWRKGPYDLFGIHIDTEWHSDWKWQRLQPYITPLKNRTVLDVGCGNGYHMWRMLGEDARLVVGADPSQFFLMQFQVFKKYIEATQGHQPVHLLPFKAEELPAFSQEFNGRGFDTVFSMGVLYHRISPIHHLQELKRFLRQGGELVLETLIIEGDDFKVLIPEDRYAKMRNVWFIPTTALLTRMLERAGFKNINIVDVNQTSLEEQRATDWMTFESLSDFLNPENTDKTIEGYPSPIRATFVCNV